METPNPNLPKVEGSETTTVITSDVVIADEVQQVEDVQVEEVKQEAIQQYSQPDALYKMGDSIDATNFASASYIIEKLIASKALPERINDVNKAFAVLQYGKDLGLSPMQAFHHIVSIKGTYTPDATALAICLRKNKIGTQVLKDCEYLYADGETFPINARFRDNPAFDEKRPIDANNQPKIQIGYIDRVTEIKYWYKDDILNEVITGTVRYYWSDAIASEKANQDTYMKYPKDMLLHKCKTKLAKQLGILSYSDEVEVREYHNEPITLKNISID
jgi:hypothetical protein